MVLEYILSISVGAISVIALFAIGWQIYNTYSFEKRMRELIDDAIEKRASVIDEKQYKIRCEAIGTALFNVAEAMASMEMYGLAINNYIKALVELSNENAETDEVDLCLDRLLNIISVIKKDYNIAISKRELDTYIGMVGSIKNNRKIEVLEFLFRLR